MYKLEDRGNITRYYNVEKRLMVQEIRGAEWKKYRSLWDATDFSSWDNTTPPTLGSKH